MLHPTVRTSALATLALVAVLLAPVALLAQPYTFSTLAGLRSGQGSEDGVGAAARFNQPYGVARDAAGNFYVADSANSVIRKITPTGVVTTFAGTAGLTGLINGTGAAARFNNPQSVAVDAAGSVYVADSANHVIRRITPDRVVTTFTGSGTQGVADGASNVAQFRSPRGLAFDSSGNLFVTDIGADTIRRVTPAGVVSTFAGSANNRGSANGTGTAATFDGPSGIAIDSAGNLYVTEIGNDVIRRITPQAVVSTFVGTAGSAGTDDGTGAAARLRGPGGIGIDGSGNLYFVDVESHTLRRATPAGVVTTIAGLAGVDGPQDGSGNAARFARPWGVFVDAAGNVTVGDTSNHAIRRVTPAGVVTTLAGTPSSGDWADGTGSQARFNSPLSTAIDASGTVYVADLNNHVIRRITAGGVVTTYAGAPGVAGDVNGPVGTARFRSPCGLALDSAGNLYVADRGNAMIRKITSAGVVSTLAGQAGSNRENRDGTGTAARFGDLQFLAVDSAGTVYATDTMFHTIRKVTAAGVTTTFAGSSGNSGYADGTGTAARFNYPRGIAVDNAGNVFVADEFNSSIRKITSVGVVSTLAGTAGSTGSTDGTGPAARFERPGGLAIDPAGTLYVADSGAAAHTIRRVSNTGVVTTLAGLPGNPGAVDGTGTAARFRSPYGLAADRFGGLYVADIENHMIRWGAASAPTLSSATTATGTVRQSFRYVATFNGAVGGPYRASGLPDGFTFDANTGTIAGTPTVAARYAIRLEGTNGAGTGSGTLTLVVNGPPVITTQPRNVSADAGSTATFRVLATGFPAPTYQWRRDGIAITRATSATLTLSNVSAADAATYSVVVANDLGRVTSQNATLTVVSGFPTIGAQPADQALGEGAQLSLGVTAAGNAPLAYQWTRDGAPIPGATGATYTVSAATAADRGDYAVTVSNGVGSVTSDVATVTVDAASALANLSVRTGLAAGQTLIVGAVMRDGAKNVLVRAAGPALAAFGLTGVVDPNLELYNGPTLVAANDDWAPNLAPIFATLSAFPFNPGSRDAALQQSLNGAVTFQARATGPGTVLVEAYDASGGLATRLANLSARSLVGTGADILIAGFNVSGANAKTMLIRAVGPGLAAFNVTGFLADPALTVVNANTGAVIASNNDWAAALAPTFTRVGAFPLTNGSRDAALLVTLPAGASYTVQVSGADGGTGEALVEIYEVF